MAITQSGTSITFNDATTQTTAPVNTNANVNSITAGTAISVSSTTGAVTVNNTGVTSLTAGSNISVSGSTGAVTISSSSSGQYQYSLATYSTAYNSNGTPLVWNSNGSLTWTAPTGVTRVKVTLVSGGGGGGGTVAGGYGGAGAQAIGVYTVTPGTGYSVTVGGGGAGGGTSSNGSSGGSSSFSSLVSATGGAGGTSGGTFGANGVGTNGNITNTQYVSGLGTVDFTYAFGQYTGGNGAVSASAVVWTPTASHVPGEFGSSTLGGGGNLGAGGYSGLVLIEYIG